MGNFFAKDIKIYLEDTDSLKVVYHANYLKFVERTLSDFLETFNAREQLSNENLMLVFTKEEINFVNYAKAGDELVVMVSLDKLMVSSMHLKFEIFRRGLVVAYGFFIIACVTSDEVKLQRLPVWFLEELDDRIIRHH